MCVSITLKATVLIIINVYVHSNASVVDDLPDLIFADECLLVGDLNARHKNLGSTGSQNHNGIILISFLSSIEDAKVLGAGEPTHLKGGRLDYAVIFNMLDVQAESKVVDTLLSDHFAIEVKLHVDKMFVNNRKRYSIKDGQHCDFQEKEVSNWYKEYKKLQIKDKNIFYEDLLQVIDSILRVPLSKKKIEVFKELTPRLRTYELRGQGKE